MKLRDGFVQRREAAESELGVCTRPTSVVVDLIARAVTRAVGDPRLVLAGCEREGDEGGAKIMDADVPALVVVHEELGPGVIEVDVAKIERGGPADTTPLAIEKSVEDP